jgi:hypothetical protein
VSSDAVDAEHFTLAVFGQTPGNPVCNFADIGSAGTGKNQSLGAFTRTFLFL